MMEYATPLLTLNNMSHDDIAELSLEDRNMQIMAFYISSNSSLTMQVIRLEIVISSYCFQMFVLIKISICQT